MKMLSVFDASNTMRDAFIECGWSGLSLDLHKGYKGNKVDIQVDFFMFDYETYDRDHFDFIFIALPCTTWSIASGAFHFKNNIPMTALAEKSILMLIRLKRMLDYFGCPFVIENPSGGLINNYYFNSLFQLYVNRLCLGAFGFYTQKKTGLFSNFPLLLLGNPIYRVNGKYQKKSLDNLSYRQRVTYPYDFCHYLAYQVTNQLQINHKK